MIDINIFGIDSNTNLRFQLKACIQLNSRFTTTERYIFCNLNTKTLYIFYKAN